MTRHSRSGVLAAATTMALVLLGLLFGPAIAWSGRHVPAGKVVPGRPAMVQPPGRVVVPNVVVGAPRASSHDFGPSYPFGYNYTRPPSGLHFAPVHTRVAPRWVAGYWGQQWVPLYHAYDVWVPGYYGPRGWIGGYYESRTVESGGYYQQVWVDGYWAR
jgi:hypothetical protein